MSLYLDIQASLFAFCKAFADEARAETIADLAIFKFDAHADINDLPQQDVIGIAAYDLENDDHLIEATCMIMISTLNDENLFRLDLLIDRLFNKLAPNSTITVVNADTAVSYGKLKIKSPIQVLPVEVTKLRPLKAIAVGFGSDHAFGRAA